MPTTGFLFWNIKRKLLAEMVAELVDEHKIDVVMLAECAVAPGQVLAALNRRRRNAFHIAAGQSTAVRIFTRFSGNFLQPTSEDDRVSIRRLTLPERAELLLAVAHLPSKLHQRDESQSFQCGPLARRICAEEDRVGHQRTVLVGDLNMNPFEAGMVAAEGLHATMSRQVANRLIRTVQGQEYRFFYNPMWSHYGDARGDTAGSYFYDNSEQVNYFWNMFDQVLIRPELAQHFDATRLSIVTSVGTRSLVRPDGRPDVANGSDHLPIRFELDF